MNNSGHTGMTLADVFKRPPQVENLSNADISSIDLHEHHEEPQTKPSRKQKHRNAKGKVERPYQPFTVICDKELVRKVKAIARKEGLHVNAVVQAMYLEGVNSYERVHGNIDDVHNPKSAKEVLFRHI